MAWFRKNREINPALLRERARVLTGMDGRRQRIIYETRTDAAGGKTQIPVGEGTYVEGTRNSDQAKALLGVVFGPDGSASAFEQYTTEGDRVKRRMYDLDGGKKARRAAKMVLDTMTEAATRPIQVKPSDTQAE
jgi:hypothetical protein